MTTQYFPSHKSLLSKPRIEAMMRAGSIIIEPFIPDHLGSDHYDVTLGPNFYREAPISRVVGERNLVGDHPIYNPYDENNVRRNWLLQKAQHHKNIITKLNWDKPLKNIPLDTRIILVRPGESILGHTNEFIGSACDHITTMMSSRSSVGRNFIEVCKCSSRGNVGFFNRWTFEITNNSCNYVLPLVVGRRIAKITFFQVDGVGVDYLDSRYQSSMNLEDLKVNWTPEEMLPKQWKDYEINNEE